MQLNRMRLNRNDRGVTLPEVLVAVTIMAIIIVPLGNALIGFVRNTDATTRRLSESHDIQLANAYFARDVKNLGVRDASLALLQSINNSSYPCTGTGTLVVRMVGDEPTSASGSTNVRTTYLVRVVGAERQLRRLECRGSAAVLTDLVVIHNLVGTPAVRCADAVDVVVSCTGSGTNLPVRVSLTGVGIKHPLTTTTTTLTLAGVRRQS